MPAIPIPGVSTPVFQSWGKSVADQLNAATAVKALPNISANAGAWVSIAALVLTGVPAGTYFCIANPVVSALASGNCYLGIRKSTEAIGVGSAQLVTGLTSVQAIAIPVIRFLAHTGGDLSVILDFGFGSGGTNVNGGNLHVALVSAV